MRRRRTARLGETARCTTRPHLGSHLACAQVTQRMARAQHAQALHRQGPLRHRPVIDKHRTVEANCRTMARMAMDETTGGRTATERHACRQPDAWSSPNWRHARYSRSVARLAATLLVMTTLVIPLVGPAIAQEAIPIAGAGAAATPPAESFGNVPNRAPAPVQTLPPDGPMPVDAAKAPLECRRLVRPRHIRGADRCQDIVRPRGRARRRCDLRGRAGRSERSTGRACPGGAA